MSNDYLELRKAASRTTPFARKQARGQASVCCGYDVEG